MKNWLKWILLSLAVLLMLAFAGFQFMKFNTKKASPEDRIVFTQGDLTLEVFYNRPSKKGRVIFGELVPYDQVWRTGANEATTFTINKPITIDGKVLKAGAYTLWTVPGRESWTVIWNDRMYPWGVDFDQKAQRRPEHDALQVQVPVERLAEPVEQFTIAVQEAPLALTLSWDDVRVTVPMAH